jgi:hypothetical protein
LASFPAGENLLDVGHLFPHGGRRHYGSSSLTIFNHL